MGKIILANIDPNAARFALKMRALGRTIIFTGFFTFSTFVILHDTWKLNLYLVSLFFAASFGLYFFRNMKRMLHSIVFDPEENIYEISIIKSGKISSFRMKKEDVKLNVRQDVFAFNGFPWGIQIVYKRKDYFIQRESGPWTNQKMNALKDLLKQGIPCK